MKKELSIGGQAVIEGVVMRGKENLAIAVRTPKDSIVIKKEKINSLTSKRFFGLPFIRGVVALIETLVIGVKALTYSANAALGEEEQEIGKMAVIMAILGALIFGIGFFALLPYVLTNFLGLREQTTPVLFNLIDGLIKLVLLVLYIFSISLMKDIRRVFEYHGAEHKTVNCYESDLELNVENAKKFSTKHPRCGTTFILFVVLMGAFIFSLIPPLISIVYPNAGNLFWVWRFSIFFAMRILFIPLIAALSYELLRLGGKHSKTFVFKIILFPGMLVQSLTTREPDEKQLEVAIAALKTVV